MGIPLENCKYNGPAFDLFDGTTSVNGLSLNGYLQFVYYFLTEQ